MKEPGICLEVKGDTSPTAPAIGAPASSKNVACPRVMDGLCPLKWLAVRKVNERPDPINVGGIFGGMLGCNGIINTIKMDC